MPDRSRRGPERTETVRPVPADAFREPEVRRWPHPVECGEPPPPDPALHYIRCALSYQNQLLSEIRALLQQLVPEEET